MLLPGTGWAEAAIRALRATRDIGWWTCLTAQNAVTEAAAEEANRLAQQVASFSDQVNGTLRATLDSPASTDPFSDRTD